MMRQYDLVDLVRKITEGQRGAARRAYGRRRHVGRMASRACAPPATLIPAPAGTGCVPHHLELDDATIAAASLHDTIQDLEQRAEIERLVRQGHRHLVYGLTKPSRLDLVTGAKQVENLRNLLLAIADDVRVLLRKLADRLAQHAGTIGHMPLESLLQIAEEIIDIYAPLAAALGMYEMREELEDFVVPGANPEAWEVVNEPRRLAERDSDLIVKSSSSLRRSCRTGASPRAQRAANWLIPVWRKMEAQGGSAS